MQPKTIADGRDTSADTPAFPDHWGIATAELFTETVSSRIWQVRVGDGRLAVVKDLKPIKDVQDGLNGADYLAWRDGIGAIRLLGRDGHRLLLEHAGGRPLSQEIAAQGDSVATGIAAEVMARLLAPPVDGWPAHLPPLRQRFAGLFAKARADDHAEVKSLYGEAARLADGLLAEPHDVRPLHGDLHHDNIISGPRGWLVLDPIGIVGDPGFDAANMFYNPLDRNDLCRDPARIAAMAESFSRVLGQSPRRLLDHAVAYGCLSASWHAEDDNRPDEERELAVALAIRAVRDRGF
ncbi:MAG: phosphotransferase [Rhizobiales bacterium]|nr:phosphotransferase [Hyphomicrobiales bacterium]